VIYHCLPKVKQNHPNATIYRYFDAKSKKRNRKADIVISMLPAHLHIEVARDCVVNTKEFGSASC
jgi:hypothetical protein